MIDQLKQEVEVMERHLEILQRVIEHEPIGIVKLGNQGGYAHHKSAILSEFSKKKDSSSHLIREQ